MFYLLTTFHSDGSTQQAMFTTKEELYQMLPDIDFEDYDVQSIEYDEHCPEQDELFKAVQEGTVASY